MLRESFKYGRTPKERKIKMAYTKSHFILFSVQRRDTLVFLDTYKKRETLRTHFSIQTKR